MEWWISISVLLCMAFGAFLGAAWGINHVSKHPVDRANVFENKFWRDYFDAWASGRPVEYSTDVGSWLKECKKQEVRAGDDFKLRQTWQAMSSRAEALEDFLALMVLEREHLRRTGFQDPPKNELSRGGRRGVR